MNFNVTPSGLEDRTVRISASVMKSVCPVLTVYYSCCNERGGYGGRDIPGGPGVPLAAAGALVLPALVVVAAAGEPARDAPGVPCLEAAAAAAAGESDRPPVVILILCFLLPGPSDISPERSSPLRAPAVTSALRFLLPAPTPGGGGEGDGVEEAICERLSLATFSLTMFFLSAPPRMGRVVDFPVVLVLVAAVFFFGFLRDSVPDSGCGGVPARLS